MFRITNRGCRGCLLQRLIDRLAVNTIDCQFFQFSHTVGSFTTYHYTVSGSLAIFLERNVCDSVEESYFELLKILTWKMQQLGEMLSTSVSQYINPDYYNPLPTTVSFVNFFAVCKMYAVSSLLRLKFSKISYEDTRFLFLNSNK